ncbi:hypothetical protein Nepgr_001391 [Nepenthes gracilis]|uniref:HD-Zip IV C-terminal domain-containing protein n=1 Tax=Nepenthes gracilis TaxID=150966 RepID=A0AAD3RW17_NEPGR|nr:hypothetical protein Nepgr_001391 [Nepenthes gracilis]
MDSSTIPILPSGFIISTDGRPIRGAAASTSTDASGLGGSLLTVSFHILACCSLSSDNVSMESVSAVNTLVSSTVEKIKSGMEIHMLD